MREGKSEALVHQWVGRREGRESSWSHGENCPSRRCWEQAFLQDRERQGPLGSASPRGPTARRIICHLSPCLYIEETEAHEVKQLASRGRT